MVQTSSVARLHNAPQCSTMLRPARKWRRCAVGQRDGRHGPGAPGCGDLRVTILRRACRAVVRPRPWPISWSHPLDRKVSVAEDFWDFCFCCKKRTETCYCLGESKRSGIESFFLGVWKPFRNLKQMNLRSRSEVWTRCWWMTLGMWPSPTMVPPSWSNWRWNIQQPRCW